MLNSIQFATNAEAFSFVVVLSWSTCTSILLVIFLQVRKKGIIFLFSSASKESNFFIR